MFDLIVESVKFIFWRKPELCLYFAKETNLYKLQAYLYFVEYQRF